MSLDERLGEECRLRFRVRDTGMGFSSGRLVSLFEPFNQADNSITRRFGGSGLGLTISRRLVRQMDGDIAVSSEPGHGSEFSFTVKLGVADDAERVHDLHQVAGLRVLVVEDCSLTARVIVSQLQAWRLMADRVSDGFAALERVAAAERTGRPYDVVLLDWQMPGLDGIQATYALVVRFPVVSVLMLSVADKTHEVAAGMAGGAAEYLVKGTRADEIAAAIKRHAHPQPDPE